jgi:molybdopterin synthase catalytic subunit
MGSDSVRVRVRVSAEPLEPAGLVRQVADDGAGAVVQFLGTVRDHSPGKPGVTHLTYEAYGEHVEAKIREVIDEAARKWELIAVSVEHRVGDVRLGEPSVAVTVSTAHRDAAFSAARYVIDELKVRAPIWKKEHHAGGAEWVRGS